MSYEALTYDHRYIKIIIYKFIECARRIKMSSQVVQNTIYLIQNYLYVLNDRFDKLHEVYDARHR